MSYFKGIQTDDLQLPSDPTCVVVMRRNAPYGADLAMQDAMIKITPEDMAQLARMGQERPNGDAPVPQFSGLSKFEVAASTRALILSLVVSWTLTDENEQPVPITSKSIDELEPEDGAFLATEARKRLAARRTEESRRPFVKLSGSPSRPGPARESRRHGS